MPFPPFFRVSNKVYSELSAYQSENAMVFADKLIAGSKRKKSSLKKFAKDSDFDEYKILRETIEGAERANLPQQPAAPDGLARPRTSPAGRRAPSPVLPSSDP